MDEILDAEMHELLAGVDALREVSSCPTHVLHLAMLLHGLNVERAAEALLRGELDSQGGDFRDLALESGGAMPPPCSNGPRRVSLRDWEASHPDAPPRNAWSSSTRSLERSMKVHALVENFKETVDTSIVEAVLEAAEGDSDLAFAQLLEMAGEEEGTNACAQIRASTPPHLETLAEAESTPLPARSPPASSSVPKVGAEEWTVVGAGKKGKGGGISRRQRRHRGEYKMGETREAGATHGGSGMGGEQLRRLAAGYRLLQRTSLRSCANATRAGDHSAAARARAESDSYARLAEKADSMASASHLQVHVDGRRDIVLDLHGQHVTEAVGLVDRAVAKLRSRASEAQRECILGLVCGLGRHSQGGRRVLLPALREHVRGVLQLSCIEADPGVLDVTIKY